MWRHLIPLIELVTIIFCANSYIMILFLYGGFYRRITHKPLCKARFYPAWLPHGTDQYKVRQLSDDGIRVHSRKKDFVRFGCHKNFCCNNYFEKFKQAEMFQIFQIFVALEETCFMHVCKVLIHDLQWNLTSIYFANAKNIKY